MKGKVGRAWPGSIAHPCKGTGLVDAVRKLVTLGEQLLNWPREGVPRVVDLRCTAYPRTLLLLLKYMHSEYAMAPLHKVIARGCVAATGAATTGSARLNAREGDKSGLVEHSSSLAAAGSSMCMLSDMH